MRGSDDHDRVLAGDAPCTVREHLSEECIERDEGNSEDEGVYPRDQHQAT